MNFQLRARYHPTDPEPYLSGAAPRGTLCDIQFFSVVPAHCCHNHKKWVFQLEPRLKGETWLSTK